VVHVRGDDHPPARDLAADELGLEPLAPGDEVHLLGDDALPGEPHLALVRAPRALLYPFGPQHHDLAFEAPV
jgi:hypothetical protein